MNELSDTKLKAYILVGSIGVAVIVSIQLISSVIHKGLEGIKLIGLS
jgi:hypothetical protein